MKKVVFGIILMLLFLILQSCYGDPEYFIRHYGSRISFKKDAVFVDNFDILFPSSDSKLNIKGLLSTRYSTCGKPTQFVLRLTYHQSNISEQFQIQPDAIEILFNDSLLLFNRIDTMKHLSDDKEFVYDISFGGDTCRTTSGIIYKFDSLAPKVFIDFNEALYINGSIMLIDTIYGYK